MAAFYSEEKDPWYPPYRMLGRHNSWSEHEDRRKINVFSSKIAILLIEKISSNTSNISAKSLRNEFFNHSRILIVLKMFVKNKIGLPYCLC
jgi:hypothetical protein